MIHSMSGGILSDPGSYTFVRVVFDGDTTPYWYITELELNEGDRVKAPRGAAGICAPATVVRVEKNVSGQVTPVPLKHAKAITIKL